MQLFLARHQPHVKGTLSGFDRLVFQGKIIALSYLSGLAAFLRQAGILMKDFGDYAEQWTEELKQQLYAQVDHWQRPRLYRATTKEQLPALALQIAERDHLTVGPVVLFSRLEACPSYEVRGNRATHRLELRAAPRRCLHFYLYVLDPDFGLIHLCLQSWLPFHLQVCVNGRAWLARRLDQLRLGYRQAGNCFLEVDDWPRAQQEFATLPGYPWATWLAGLVPLVHPAHPKLFAPAAFSYYWTVIQSEWATDVTFADPAYLPRIYPALTRGAVLSFNSQRLLRFFGHRRPTTFAGEVTTRYERRPEGLCVRHQVGANALKMYDKAPTVLRIESTLNAPTAFSVLRTTPQAPTPHLVPLRKGVADLGRRCEVTQAANERYLDALATLDTDRPIGELVRPLCRPARLGRQRVRGLRPWHEGDRQLCAAVADGALLAYGFRHRELLTRLYPTAAAGTPTARRRAAGQVTRQLRLLRAHGLIKKVPHTHRYLVTARGRTLLTALTQAQQLTLKQITTLAS